MVEYAFSFLGKEFRADLAVPVVGIELTLTHIQDRSACESFTFGSRSGGSLMPRRSILM